MTLAEHIQKLFDERRRHLAEVPDDAPAFMRDLRAQGLSGRLADAAAIEVEINEGIVLMRQLGWLPGRGEQSAGETPGGEAAQS